MTQRLPPVIEAFFQAHNTGETANFNELFTSNAIVRDESHEYRGEAIKEWMDNAIANFQPIASITDLAEADTKTIATAQVRGNFPGSPIQLRYIFTLNAGIISALEIVP